MAYTVVITKSKIDQISPTEFVISIFVEVGEDGTPLIEKVYSKRYTQGDSMVSVKSVLLQKIQYDWAKLVAEKALFDSAAFGTMCSEIQATIETYIS